AADGVELHTDAKMANRLLRLDECASDVMVANEPHSHRDARRLGVADGGADAGVGNRHDDIGLNRGLARERTSKLRPHLVDALAKYVAIRTREVHVFEDALRLPRRTERLD